MRSAMVPQTALYQKQAQRRHAFFATTLTKPVPVCVDKVRWESFAVPAGDEAGRGLLRGKNGIMGEDLDGRLPRRLTAGCCDLNLGDSDW